MQMRRILRGHFGRLEPQMVIAMGLLGLPAGAHEVYLRAHLIPRPDPSLADRGNRRVGEIGGKDGGIGHA